MAKPKISREIWMHVSMAKFRQKSCISELILFWVFLLPKSDLGGQNDKLARKIRTIWGDSEIWAHFCEIAKQNLGDSSAKYSDRPIQDL